MSIGDLLKSCRENKRLTVEEVSSAIRIGKKYIHALEDENYLLIPSQVFAKGFLKAYSDYLGLDTRSLLDELARFYKTREDAKKSGMLQSKPQSLIFGIKPLIAVYSAISIALLLFLTIEYGLYSRKWQPVVMQRTEVTAEASAKIPPKNIVTVKVEVMSRSWVSISVDGRVILNETLEAGSVKNFTGKVITVKTGNGAGVRISRDGKLLGLLGQPSSVAEQTYRVQP